MGADSKIEWTDHTFNAWIGCTKVSPACDRCYAEAWSKRYGRAVWGPGESRERTSAANWRQPLKWDREAEAAGVKRFVFCNSLSDVFDNEVDPAWRRDLFDLINATPNLVWLLLTKRVGNVEKMVDVFGANQWPSNAWLGATVIDQPEADRDVPKLLRAKAELGIPRVFLSIEPMLGPIDLRNHMMCDACGETPFGLFSRDPLSTSPMPIHDAFQCPLHWWPSDGCDGVLKHGIDWVICGGESGKDARPMHPDWARSLRDQCAAAGVSFTFKQWGEWGPIELEPPGCAAPMGVICSDGDLLLGEEMTSRADDPDAEIISRFGKARAGRLLDGVEHNGRPANKDGG